MKNKVIGNVPRYFEPFVNDCFSNAYASVLSHKGYNPHILLADYLSFMYEEDTGNIGTTYMFKDYTTVEFSEEELNSSLEFAYFPATANYQGQSESNTVKDKDKIHFQWYIHDDCDIAFTRTKELIDADKPVIAFVNLYNMKYHNYFQQKHVLHSIILTGYHQDTECFELFDKYALGACDYDGTMSFEEIRIGRNSIIPIVNPLVEDQQRPIRNLWVEIDIGPEFQVTDDKIMSLILESCKRMTGEKKVLGQVCGVARIQALRNDFLLRKEVGLDERMIFRIKDYYFQHFKTVSRSRKRFKIFIEEVANRLPLSKEEIEQIAADLDQSAKLWQIASTLVLKLSIVKKVNLIDDLDNQFAMIMELEARAIERLFVRCV
jgi:hypothetical protein